MCAGLARWLRVFGVDSSYQPGIKDADLVHHALREHRVVVSADGKLFERRVFVTDELAGLRLPVGLRLYDQLGYVVKGLGLHADAARCALCNGELLPVQRTEVADVVPARSLIVARIAATRIGRERTGGGFARFERAFWGRNSARHGIRADEARNCKPC